MPLPLLAGAGIGAGLGALSHLFGHHTPPPPPMTPGMNQAQNYWGGQMQTGDLARQGMTDPHAFQQFQAPSLSMLDPMFARMREQAMNAARMQNTGPTGMNARAMMMGGAEHLGGVDQLQAQTNYQNQSDTLQRMMALMGMGASGAQQGWQSGQEMRYDPLRWKQADASIPRSDIFSSILGGASMGAALAGGHPQQPQMQGQSPMQMPGWGQWGGQGGPQGGFNPWGGYDPRGIMAGGMQNPQQGVNY